MEDRKMPVSGARILALLDAIQTVINMVSEMGKGRGGHAWHAMVTPMLDCREDCDGADFGDGSADEEDSDSLGGSIVIMDMDCEIGPDCYLEVPIRIWDEKDGSPLLDASDFARALGQIGDQVSQGIQDYADEGPEEGGIIAESIRRYDRLARLLTLDGLWTDDADSYAEVGLSNARWVEALIDMDGTIRALQAEVANRRIIEEIARREGELAIAEANLRIAVMRVKDGAKYLSRHRSDGEPMEEIPF